MASSCLPPRMLHMNSSYTIQSNFLCCLANICLIETQSEVLKSKSRQGWEGEGRMQWSRNIASRPSLKDYRMWRLSRNSHVNVHLWLQSAEETTNIRNGYCIFIVRGLTRAKIKSRKSCCKCQHSGFWCRVQWMGRQGSMGIVYIVEISFNL